MLALWAGSAVAQHWITHESCTVDEIALHPGAFFAPDDLDRIIEKGAGTPNGVGKYWQITSPEGAVSHLWGTMHLNDPLILDLPDPVLSQIKRARVVAVEIDFTFTSRRQMEHTQSRAGYFRSQPVSGAVLENNIDPRGLDWLRSRLHSIGWGREAAEHLTPAGLAEISIYPPCNDFDAGVYPTQDSLIQTLGAIGGAQIVPLEAPSEFIKHLSLEANQQLAYDIINLYGSMLDPNIHPKSRATSYALYQKGLIGAAMAWEESYFNNFVGAPEGSATLQRVDAYLLALRNRNFLDKARPELEKGGVFMAIGAWHLPAKQGMVALLRDAGYTVTRTPLPKEVAP